MNTEPASSASLTTQIQGVWWLLSRIDRTADGRVVDEPVLGQDPLGILTYGKGYFAAQFMKRNRQEVSAEVEAFAGQNNTRAVGGYDAYFGTFTVDENTGHVAHTLLGSINPDNIGITVNRKLAVENNQLTIEVNTTSLANESVTRTLTWKKVS